jgi:hypothetical protein
MIAAAAPMPPGAAPPENALAALVAAAAPFEIDRFGASFGLGPARPSGEITFRFCFRDVPFTARTGRRAEQPMLHITGDLGYLPFTIENPTRRRRLRTALSAARHGSGLRWEIAERNLIRASGEIDLGRPLTPTAVVAGAATLLLRGQPYLELIVAVAGEG